MLSKFSRTAAQSKNTRSFFSSLATQTTKAVLGKFVAQYKRQYLGSYDLSGLSITNSKQFCQFLAHARTDDQLCGFFSIINRDKLPRLDTMMIQAIKLYFSRRSVYFAVTEPKTNLLINRLQIIQFLKQPDDLNLLFTLDPELLKQLIHDQRFASDLKNLIGSIDQLLSSPLHLTLKNAVPHLAESLIHNKHDLIKYFSSGYDLVLDEAQKKSLMPDAAACIEFINNMSNRTEHDFIELLGMNYLLEIYNQSSTENKTRLMDTLNSNIFRFHVREYEMNDQLSNQLAHKLGI